MKIRLDFVTNSSSSSFICEICGENVSGWDMSLGEAEMYECQNGHTFCQEHAYEITEENRDSVIKDLAFYDGKWNEEGKEKLEKMSLDELWDYATYDEGCIPQTICPICQFDEYSDRDMKNYLLKKYQVPEEDVFAKIKAVNKRRKKLYPSEYIAHVAREFNVDLSEVQVDWKRTFGSYEDFKRYIGS